MKFNLKTTICAAVLATCASALVATSANAAGFAIREQSAEGQGASFAGIAAGGATISSMFFNPATMTLHEGFVSESVATLINPYSKATNGNNGVLNLNPSSGNIGSLAFVPASYYSYQVNDRIWFGASINSPFGLVTKNDGGWAGALHGLKSDVLTMNLSPSIAIKLSDSISMSIGVQIEYIRAILTTGAPTGIDLARLAKLRGDDVGIGFTLGLLLRPTETTSIGIGLRSGIHHSLRGRATGPAITTNFGGPTAFNADLETPAIATIGLRQRVGEQLTLLAGFELADWGSFQRLTATAPKFGNAVISSTKENWRTSWTASLGAEYAVNEFLTVRAGAAFERTSVPNSTRTPRVPDNDRVWVSAGGTYRWSDSITLTAAYSHIFVKDGKINLPASPSAPLPLTANYKQHVDIASVSAQIHW